MGEECHLIHLEIVLLWPTEISDAPYIDNIVLLNWQFYVITSYLGAKIYNYK